MFGLSEPSISRRILAAAGALTHEIMAQGRWKTARMVKVYTRAEEAGRAAKWLA